MAGKLTILLPGNPEKTGSAGLAHRPLDLKGKVVGLVDNVVWTSTKMTFQELDTVLKKEYGAAGTVYAPVNVLGATDQELKDLAQKVDVAIVGLGN